MPRQLPWLNKGGGSRGLVKQPPKSVRKPRIQNDIDDAFFEGTALASSRKSKERAVSEESDDLPELSNAHTQTSRKGKEPVGRARLPSSSPPPLSATLPPPKIEYMHRGIDKFDLRDDEWMMVEDELLQTAKLFTQHLHLAEYERMKADMEERKKKSAARPVVADAKPSDEAHFNKRAKELAKTQKKALKDIFAATSNEDRTDPAKRIKAGSKVPASKPQNDPAVQSLKNNRNASESDDLDAPKRPTNNNSMASKTSTLVDEVDPRPTSTQSIKPALPLNARARAKLRRPTPFDMWDDYTPDHPSSPPKTSTTLTTQRPSSTPKVQGTAAKPTSSIQSSSTLPSPRTKVDLLSNLDFPKRDRLSKKTSDHLVKRKVEWEKETPSKSRKTIDDIPTFLF